MAFYTYLNLQKIHEHVIKKKPSNKINFCPQNQKQASHLGITMMQKMVQILYSSDVLVDLIKIL